MNKLDQHFAKIKDNAAILGMPKSEVADKLEDLENLFKREFMTPWPGRTRRLLRISRQQSRELALAHAKVLNDATAAEANAEQGKQYIELAAELRGLRSFLAEHFESELQRAEVEKKSLFDVVKGILINKG